MPTCKKADKKHNRHVYTNVELSGPRQLKVEMSGPRQIHVDTVPCGNDGPGHVQLKMTSLDMFT